MRLPGVDTVRWLIFVLGGDDASANRRMMAWFAWTLLRKRRFLVIVEAKCLVHALHRSQSP